MYVCLYFVVKMAPGLTPWLSSRRTWGPLWVLSWVSCAWVPSPQSSSTLVLFFPFFFFWFNFFFRPLPWTLSLIIVKALVQIRPLCVLCWVSCACVQSPQSSSSSVLFFSFFFFLFYFIYIYFFCLLPWTLSLIIVKALIQIRPRYFLVNIRSPL